MYIPTKEDAIKEMFLFVKSLFNKFLQMGTEFYNFYIYAVLYKENPYYGLKEENETFNEILNKYSEKIDQ